MWMARRLLLTIIACGVVMPVAAGITKRDWRDAPNQNEYSFLTEPANRLGSRVFGQLVGPSKTSNVVFSPFSMSSALDVLTLGASGNTLRILEKQREIKSSSLGDQAHLQRDLRSASSGDTTLTFANSVWLEPTARPRAAFLAAARSVFDADIANVDFRKADTVNAINAWVNKNTKGAIPRIVDTLDRNTPFVIVNATYFKGKWAFPFDKESTKTGLFTRGDGSKVDVPIMNGVNKVDYLAGDRWHAVALPYRGDRFEMLIVTAKELKDVERVRQELQSRLFQVIGSQKFEARDVLISLPRFRVEYGTNLTGALSRLGLGPVFGSNADFSMLTDAEIDSTVILQRAMVEVNEEGSEAAAATAVVTSRSAQAAPVSFNADRPFGFAILDKKTGTHLFVGYVADPKAGTTR